MKKLIITCSLVACASAASFAQNAKPAPALQNGAQQAPVRQMPQMTPEQMQQRETQAADRQSKVFEKQYSLNPTQTKGVYDACMTFMKDMDAMRMQGKQPTREDQEKMMQKRDAGFQKAMSSEQYAKYAATRSKSSAQQMQQTPVKK